MGWVRVEGDHAQRQVRRRRGLAVGCWRRRRLGRLAEQHAHRARAALRARRRRFRARCFMKLHEPARDEPARRGGGLPSRLGLLAAHLEPPVGAHRGEQAAARAERERPHSEGGAAPRHGEVGRRSHPRALWCARARAWANARTAYARMHECARGARCTGVCGVRCAACGVVCAVPAVAAGRSPARRSRPGALRPRETTPRRSSSLAAWRTAPRAPGRWRVGCHCARLHSCMDAFVHECKRTCARACAGAGHACTVHRAMHYA